MSAGASAAGALSTQVAGWAQALVLARLAPRLRTQPFAPSYWAFTFGVTALALAPLRTVARGADDLGWLAAGPFMVANVVVGGIAIRTVTLAARGHPLPAPIRDGELSEGGRPIERIAC